MEDLLLTLAKLLGVLAIVLLNGFFVAAELALVKVRDTQLDMLVARGHRRAKIARHLIHHLDSAISATQLGITLASLGLGVLVAPVFATLLEPLFDWLAIQSATARHLLAIGVGFFTNTYLLIVAGELAPKVIAIRKTLPVALWVASPLAWFVRLTYPFIWLLNHSAQWLLRQVGLELASETELAHSEEELRLLITVAQKRSGRSRLQRDIVLNALDLPRRVVREIMRPRQEIVVLDTEASMTECLDVAEKSRYSRFPLCEGGQVDKSLGVVHIKDLYAMRLRAKRGRDLLPAARKLVYLPATARLEKLLHLLLERKLHLALVVDEYGGTIGLVTLENILEELVGQIQDEFDQEKPLLAQVNDHTWELSGALPLHELSELVGESLVGENITTVSGWITQRLGGFPKQGEVVLVRRGELRVDELDGPRVARVRFIRAADAAAPAVEPGRLHAPETG